MFKDLIYNIYNFGLRVRYDLFKPKTRKSFDGEIIFHRDGFTDLSEFDVRDNEFLNSSDNWSSKDMVRIEDNVLKLDCIYDPATHTSWQGTREASWIAAMVQTDVLINYGTWSVTARAPDSFPAIWLMREKHINSEGVLAIIPEVDIMEVINDKFQHAIHAKPIKTERSYIHRLTKDNYFRYDNDIHEFTVDLTPKGYKFYVDGILTAHFISDDETFTSDVRSYLKINSAEHNVTDHRASTTHEIHKIVIRKNKYTTTDLDNPKPWIK